jgi:hypothetical protein
MKKSLIFFEALVNSLSGTYKIQARFFNIYFLKTLAKVKRVGIFAPAFRTRDERREEAGRLEGSGKIERRKIRNFFKRCLLI